MSARPRRQAREEGGTTREDWFRAALQLLIADGIERVKVLSLTQRLGASRSSFYWFFKNRDDLLAQLLEHWRQKNTGALLARARRSAPSITAAVMNVFECAIDEAVFDVRLDTAIRDWARNDAAVDAAMRAADAERIEALRQMFTRYGYPPGEDFIRARVLYLTQVGYHLVERDEDLQTRFGYLPDYLFVLTGRPAPQAEIDEFAARRGFPPPSAGSTHAGAPAAAKQEPR